jgi:hypothetical protein
VYIDLQFKTAYLLSAIERRLVDSLNRDLLFNADNPHHRSDHQDPLVLDINRNEWFLPPLNPLAPDSPFWAPLNDRLREHGLLALSGERSIIYDLQSYESVDNPWTLGTEPMAVQRLLPSARTGSGLLIKRR